MAVRSAGTSMGRGGYRWNRLKLQVYATYGPICWICDHPIPGGASGGEADHIIPRCERPDLEFVLDNLRPIHGGKQRCPDCGHRCNQVRQARPVDYARRKVSTPVPGFTPPVRKPQATPGRAW